MKITIITAFFPYPLVSGGNQAQYNMIDGLRGIHNITVIFPVNRLNTYKAMEQLKEKWPEVKFRPYPYYKQLTYFPFVISKLRRAFGIKVTPKSNRFKVNRALKPYGYPISKNFVSFVNDVIKENRADIVQMEFYPYLRLINYLPTNIKRVFVHHEIKFVRDIRLTKGLKLTHKDISLMDRLKSDEVSDLNKYDEIVTLTPVDKDILVSIGVKTPILVSSAAINTQIKKYSSWNKTLVFVGGATHTPNVEGLEWFCNEVSPLIDWKEQFRDVVFKVVGNGWNEHHVFGIPNGNVCFTGFVPKLEDAVYGGVMLVPILSGSGMRMKILEGMALGLPIITTSIGKEGIDIVNEESCLISDTPELFAQAIVRIISDEELRRYLATNAQQFFIKNYSKNTLIAKRNKLYEL